MLAVLYVLFSENLADRRFMADHSVGLDQLERYVMGLAGSPPASPEWAATICGVATDEIVRFARCLCRSGPAMLFPGYSSSACTPARNLTG